jgi:hypothetical protein
MLWTQFPLGTRPRNFYSKVSLIEPLSRQVSLAKNWSSLKVQLLVGNQAALDEVPGVRIGMFQMSRELSPVWFHPTANFSPSGFWIF